MEVLDLTTNVSQIFTEMYKKYSMLSNNQINVFENSPTQRLTFWERVEKWSGRSDSN